MLCCAYLQFIAMLNRAEMVQHIIQNFDAELQITQTHLIFSEHPLALALQTASSRQVSAV